MYLKEDDNHLVCSSNNISSTIVADLCSVLTKFNEDFIGYENRQYTKMQNSTKGLPENWISLKHGNAKTLHTSIRIWIRVRIKIGFKIRIGVVSFRNICVLASSCTA